MALSFNKRIEIVDIVAGGGPEAWMPGGEEEVLIARPWADIKTMKGTEIQTLGLSAHEMTSRFIIRYQSGIEHKHKIKYKGQTYNIESITNDNEQNRTITIIAKAYS